MRKTYGYGTFAFLLFAFLPALALLQSAHDPSSQTPSLFEDEAQVVYLGNLQRRENGVAPLRWNHQLTLAARWFSWDSTENELFGFCSHLDSQGYGPSDRIVRFGYPGFGGAENAFCAYVYPMDAITGWMSSSGHRANLLDPNSREIGVGYYQRSGGRGYITQDFGVDSTYPPVVINNEAPASDSQDVNLYIYDRPEGAGLLTMQPAQQMQISNDACFQGVIWEPYAAEKAWKLAPGSSGWRSVYVRTRDALNRTQTASDSIYYGPSVPQDQLSFDQMSDVQPGPTLTDLNGSGLPFAQFSLDWIADDTDPNFEKLWGTGEQISDPAAIGGTAFRLGPPDPYSETSAWTYTTDFYKDVPMVAYLRLKVGHNTSTAEVARFSVTNKGGTSVRSIKGTDFKAGNTYQEFPVPFTFSQSDTFLIFQFFRSGSTDVFIDAVSVFTAPQSFQSQTTWQVPGGVYRGQGIWVRYTDGGSNFSEIQEGVTHQPGLMIEPRSVALMLAPGSAPVVRKLAMQAPCAQNGITAITDAAWLQVAPVDGFLQLTVDPDGLSIGAYTAVVTVQLNAEPEVPPVLVEVRLSVVENAYQIFTPLSVYKN